MGGKSDAPAPPNYQPIAQASLEQAQIMGQTSKDQLDFAKQQYADIYPYVKDYMASQKIATEAETQQALSYNERYNRIYGPMEEGFASEASGWNTPARQEQDRARAGADVATAFNQQRKAALDTLGRFGVDPSTTRFAALDSTYRINQAAATASAETQAGLGTELTGLGLTQQAINTGRGYAGDSSTLIGAGTQAGKSGISAANQTFATGSEAMGTPVQYAGLANQSRAGATSALNAGFQNELGAAQFNQQNDQNFMQGLGSIVGGALGVGKLFLSDRRLKTDVERIGVLDNGLPIYRFRYRGDQTIYIGLMADEVEKVRPYAVGTTTSGYKAVDYDAATRTT